ncbi:hypothetical protein [Mesorhizobium sp. L48C026A00]|uniref:hypothetical protein n=1 Tax=Mesorhizobium sp. L48C026A00 TaxID=1287182 RepID=UPI0003D04632|nr:hypothetical protein [Mesorhizobium sp. L48C026A00]ESZ11923.1 hypothetical protein X737_29060 [Mesorhizobium sp. L48C026A00]
MTNVIDQFGDEREFIEAQLENAEALLGQAGALLKDVEGIRAGQIGALQALVESLQDQLPLIDRDTIEQLIADANSHPPDDDYDHFPVTLLDVMTALLHGENSDAEAVVKEIHHTILHNIRLNDPWPELTRETLILLIGKRKSKADSLGFYNMRRHDRHNEPYLMGMPSPLPPLTLAEKLLAARWRGWLIASDSQPALPLKPLDRRCFNAAS